MTRKKKTVSERLKLAFMPVMLNPSQKNIRKYKELENALLAFWLKEFFSSLLKGINEQTKRGSKNAVEQLRKHGFEKTGNNTEKLKNIAQAKKERLKTDLQKVVAGVKSTSRRMIAELQEEQILPPSDKKVSWRDIFLTYGVAYFTDKAGRAWDLERYEKTVRDTAEYTAYRDAMFATSEEYNNDLVRIIHNGNEPPCDLCDPFQGKILSLTGKTEGYMTVDEAKSYGLFHINCYCDFELAPTEHAGDKEVVFSEANEKAKTRNERRF